MIRRLAATASARSKCRFAANLVALALLAAVVFGLAACRGASGETAAQPEGSPELTVAIERPIDPPLPDRSDDPILLPPPVVRLGVGSVDRSATFYRDLLGFVLVDEAPVSSGNAAEPAVRLTYGDLRLELLPASGTEAAALTAAPAPAAGTPLLLVEVPDAAALFDRVGDRVALVRALTDRADGHREFSIADPDGHLLVFRQPVGSALRSPG